MNVILSIKPLYARAIMAGIKKVEFRKKIFKREVDKVFIYATAPEKLIIGYFTIDEVVKDTPEKLWKQFNVVGGIDKSDFFEYYKDTDTGYSIKINEVKQFEVGINPLENIENFNPPQSFQYLDESIAQSIIVENI